MKNKYEQWLNDLHAVEKEKQAGFIRVTLEPKSMLDVFGRYFFPHIIKGQENVPECHLDLINEVAKRNDSAIVFPRGHAKSTWIKLDTIHDIVYGTEPVILYISNVLQDARFHFESIKQELENNHLLQGVYGDLVPEDRDQSKKWTNTHFETSNGINVVARGAGKGRGVNIKNQRPTKIICDDIEDDEQVSSPERREKLHNWLYQVIFPSKDKDRGFIKMVGTIIHPHCEVLRYYKKHGGIFRRAIEEGKALWWTMDELMREKEKIGTRAFNQEFMNEPAAAEDQTIKERWITDSYYTHALEIKNMNLIMAIDPQAGEKEASDEMGLCLLAYTKGDPHRYVVKSAGKREKLTYKARIVVEWWLENRDRIKKVAIEVVLNQNALWQIIQAWVNGENTIPNMDHIKDRNMPIMQVSPKGKDKLARLQMHEAAFERGEIHLRPENEELKDQLIHFPNVAHDDRMDALLYALEKSYDLTDGEIKVDPESHGGTIVGDLMSMKF